MKAKFTLPVGAVLAGLRHLGNGEFIGIAPVTREVEPTPENPLLKNVPFVLEGEALVHAETDEETEIHAEICIDPLDAHENKWLRAYLTKFYHEGKCLTEREMIDLARSRE